jgi:PAS domain S-box-containing protein
MNEHNNNLTDATLLRQKAEEQLQVHATNSQLASTLTSEYNLLKLIHELEVHQIELKMQNDELIAAIEKAEIAQEKYTELYDFAPSGYLSLSKKGEITDLNFIAAQMLGRERSYLAKKQFALFVSDNTRSDFNQFLKNIFTHQVKQNCEVIITNTDNLPLYVTIDGIVSQNNDSCLLTLVDITGRKIADFSLINAKEQAEESELQYRNLADSGSALIWTSGTDKLCNYFNEPWLKFTGRTLEQEMGNGWAESVHLDDLASCINTYITAFDKHEAFEMEYRMLHVSGEYRWILDMGTPNFNSTGTFIGYIGHCFDITDRKLIENTQSFLLKCGLPGSGEDFFESLARYLAQTLSMEYVCIDRLEGDGLTAQTVAIYNEGRYESNVQYALKDTPCGEVVDKSVCCYKNGVRHLFPKDEALNNLNAESYAGITLVNSKGRAIGLIAIIGHKPLQDERLAKTLLNLVALRAAGELERREAENALKEMLVDLNAEKIRAEESDRLKSAFLANMSHEIRTPMNGILGFAELLKEPELTGEKQYKYISIIEKSGTRLLNIINDLIDISKIEANLMKIEIKEANINEQIEFIFTFFEPEIKDKGMECSFTNSLPANEAIIKTDREKVYAILTNLVKNAIKYTNEGTIEFGYVKKGNELEFYVKDTGIGIPKNKQKAIFDRFVQAKNPEFQAGQGAGLGLSITKAFLKMLGGKIWVESEVGIGSTFYFTLPYTTEPKVKQLQEMG